MGGRGGNTGTGGIGSKEIVFQYRISPRCWVQMDGDREVLMMQILRELGGGVAVGDQGYGKLLPVPKAEHR